MENIPSCSMIKSKLKYQAMLQVREVEFVIETIDNPPLPPEGSKFISSV